MTKFANIGSTKVPGVHSQVDLLFDHMINKGRITPMQAHELYRVNSFHRRMADLREMGVKFDKERKRDNTGRAYVEYVYTGLDIA